MQVTQTPSSLSRSGIIKALIACASVMLLLPGASIQVARAQTQSTDTQSPPPASAATASGQKDASAAAPVSQVDERYRIGPGDVLDIRIFNRPQLSRESVRVDQSGLIQMPLIESDIKAACLTEAELAKEIATLYLKYQRHPYVNVFVKEFSSTPVAVIGAVEKPGRFQLQRRVRLLELLAFAGGQTEKAGARIQLARTGGDSLCEAPADDAATEAASESFVYFNLKDTLRGDAKSNPYVHPGDIVNLPEADQAYVVGNVFKPQAVPLKDPVTVSQAIAMAGGTLPATKSTSIRIIRQSPGGTEKRVITVDLGAINKQRAEDVALQANDIVEVPTSSGKKIFNSIVNAISPVVSNLPVYVLR
jgi:polysaccharide export outer membrane protein